MNFPPWTSPVLKQQRKTNVLGSRRCGTLAVTTFVKHTHVSVNICKLPNRGAL